MYHLKPTAEMIDEHLNNASASIAGGVLLATPAETKWGSAYVVHERGKDAKKMIDPIVAYEVVQNMQFLSENLDAVNARECKEETDDDRLTRNKMKGAGSAAGKEVLTKERGRSDTSSDISKMNSGTSSRLSFSRTSSGFGLKRKPLCDFKSGATVLHYAMDRFDMDSRSLDIIHTLISGGMDCSISSNLAKSRKGDELKVGGSKKSRVDAQSVSSSEGDTVRDIIQQRRNDACKEVKGAKEMNAEEVNVEKVRPMTTSKLKQISDKSEYGVTNILATYISGEFDSVKALKEGKGCSVKRLSRLERMKKESERQRRKLRDAAFVEFCDEHSNPIDMIFNMYEDGFWWWKFFTQFFERGALIFIVTFWGGEEGTAMFGLVLSAVLIGIMMLGSWWAEPFIDPEQDDIDKITRLTNFINIIMGVIVESGAEGTDTAALFVLSFVNLANFVAIVRSLKIVELLDGFAGVIASARDYQRRFLLDEEIKKQALSVDLLSAICVGDKSKAINLTKEKLLNFHYSIESKEALGTFKKRQLEKEGASVGNVTESVRVGWTLAHAAAASGDPEILSRLVGKGSPIDKVDIEGESPLHVAYRFGSMLAAKILEQAGANTGARSDRVLEDGTVVGFKPAELLDSESIIKSSEAGRFKDVR